MGDVRLLYTAARFRQRDQRVRVGHEGGLALPRQPVQPAADVLHLRLPGRPDPIPAPTHPPAPIILLADGRTLVDGRDLLLRGCPQGRTRLCPALSHRRARIPLCRRRSDPHGRLVHAARIGQAHRHLLLGQLRRRDV